MEMTNDEYFKIVSAMQNDVNEIDDETCQKRECLKCEKVALCLALDAIENMNHSGSGMTAVDLLKIVNDYANEKGI